MNPLQKAKNRLRILRQALAELEATLPPPELKRAKQEVALAEAQVKQASRFWSDAASP